jgi:hypothetical protein
MIRTVWRIRGVILLLATCIMAVPQAMAATPPPPTHEISARGATAALLALITGVLVIADRVRRR